MNGSETHIKKEVLDPGRLYWRHYKQQQTREDQQEDEKEGPKSPYHREKERKETPTQGVSNLQQQYQADIRRNK